MSPAHVKYVRIQMTLFHFVDVKGINNSLIFIFIYFFVFGILQGHFAKLEEII